MKTLRGRLSLGILVIIRMRSRIETLGRDGALMDRGLEIRVGTRIDDALGRIRVKMCRLGMASKWHIGKASDLLQNLDRLKQYVEPLNEHDEARYIDQLPGLIEEAKEQDRY